MSDRIIAGRHIRLNLAAVAVLIDLVTQVLCLDRQTAAAAGELRKEQRAALLLRKTDALLHRYTQTLDVEGFYEQGEAMRSILRDLERSVLPYVSVSFAAYLTLTVSVVPDDSDAH